MTELENLKKKISNQKKQISNLLKQIHENEFEQFDLKENDYVFIESITYLGEIRTYTGWIVKEAKKHIKLKVIAKKQNREYFYIIGKNFINGIKIYSDDTNETNNER